MTTASRIFQLSLDIRYVALYSKGALTLSQRPELDFTSDSESDRYEELLVNPSILTLARQRGDIDCGGMEFVIVSYGYFHQLVMPHDHGHVSVAFEKTANPLHYAFQIRSVINNSLDQNPIE